MDVSKMKVDKLLKLLENFDKVTAVDDEKLERAITPVDKVVMTLQEKKALDRRMKATKARSEETKAALAEKRPKKCGRPKTHWRRKAKLLKARKARHYQNTVRPRRLKQYEEYLNSGDWYSICLIGWQKKPATKNPQLAREEWEEHIAPKIPEGRVIVTRRVDTSKGISLENIEVVDTDTREVYFSGLDYALYRAMDESPQMDRKEPD